MSVPRKLKSLPAPETLTSPTEADRPLELDPPYMECTSCKNGDHESCETGKGGPAMWTTCQCWWRRHGISAADWSKSSASTRLRSMRSHPSKKTDKKETEQWDWE